MTKRQLCTQHIACLKVVFVVIALVAAYRTSLQVATGQSPPESSTSFAKEAMKLRERTIQEESVSVAVKNTPSQAKTPARRISSSTSVVLNVDHAQPNELGGGPSFRIALRNWAANGEISIHLVGPKGEVISVVPPERPIHASPEGSATVTVPYKHRGLYPGVWLLMVAGPSGIHQGEVEIPKVLPRNSKTKEERLVFKTRNTLSSFLPYHFGVYEPPAENPPNPRAAAAPPSIDQKASASEQKQLERTATAPSPAPVVSASPVQTSSDSPSPSEPSQSRNTSENDDAPPDAVIEGKLRILNLAGKSYKRGEPLISTGGQIPRGTVLYPIRISMLAAAGSEVSDLYFFRDAFKEWKCLWRQMGRIL